MMSSALDSSCQQPPSAGILELLGEGKQVANLTECQYVEALVNLCQDVADPLQNSPLQVRILQQVGGWEQLGCKLGFC